MTVALLPPITNSGTWTSPGTRTEALAEAPAFIRNRGRLWHRPRSGTRWTGPTQPDGRVSWHAWCGQILFERWSITRDDPPVDEPVCGTCEGRALAAGQLPSDTDYETSFTPRWVDPPTICPGSGRSRLWLPVGRSAGRCLVCGAIEATRHMGGGYNGDVGIVRHPPANDLMPLRCDFHGWRYLTRSGDTAACECLGGSS